MEFLAVLVIVIMLCLILDISVLRILIGVLVILGLITITMMLLFTYYFFQIFFTRRKQATYLRIDSSPYNPFRVAYYQVGDQEYPCVFPAEGIMRTKLYRRDRATYVMFSRRMGRVYDKYAMATCTLGFLLSMSAVAVMAGLVRELMM